MGGVAAILPALRSEVGNVKICLLQAAPSLSGLWPLCLSPGLAGSGVTVGTWDGHKVGPAA